MEKTLKKTFAKLGYSHLDTAEMVTLLNRLLAGYTVYQQKLRNFLWNVAGQDFFDIHNLFNIMFQRSVNETDKIAKRIRLFGQKPASTLAEYLTLSSIGEEDSQVTSYEMANIILGDIRILLEIMEKCVDSAKEINDNGTEFMVQSFIYRMENEHWMLTEWIRQKT
jgi:starvation-inducible DNA-binding protein